MKYQNRSKLNYLEKGETKEANTTKKPETHSLHSDDPKAY